MRNEDTHRRGGYVTATIFTVVGVAVLVGLGVWQLDRKVWKENLIATLTQRLSGAPAPLPPRDQWPHLTESADEYRRVSFPAQFIPGQEALVYTAGSAFRPDVQGPGYWVFAPARLPGGSIVIVDRGFIPLDRQDAATRAEDAPQGVVDLVGVLRWPEKRGFFTPSDQPDKNIWYLRDPRLIAAAKKWDTAAPFYVEQESPVPPNGWPRPGKLVVALPDNHLQYALTWFAMALGLAGVYVVWLAGRLRGRA